MSTLDRPASQSAALLNEAVQSPDTGPRPAGGVRRQRAQSRWLICAIFFNFIAIGVDWLALGDIFRHALAVRLFGLLPLMLVALGLQRWSSNLRLRSFMTAASVVAFVILIAALGQVGSDFFSSRYLMIAVFVLFAAILFAGLPLAETRIVYAVSSLAYALIVITSFKMTIIYNNIDLAFLCVSTCGLALVLRRRQDLQMSEIFRMRQVDADRSAELCNANEQLALLSMTDALTGVFNRRHLMQLADTRPALKAIYPAYSVLMIDADHFKTLNDHSGHAEGDRCLRLIADALKAEVRSADDSIVRYGGEEFAIILWNADLRKGLEIAERLRSAIAELKIPHPAMGPSGYLSISVGVYSARREEDLTEALKCADEALYIAKQAGRNRVSTLPQVAKRLAS